MQVYTTVARHKSILTYIDAPVRIECAPELHHVSFCHRSSPIPVSSVCRHVVRDPDELILQILLVTCARGETVY